MQSENIQQVVLKEYFFQNRTYNTYKRTFKKNTKPFSKNNQTLLICYNSEFKTSKHSKGENER